MSFDSIMADLEARRFVPVYYLMGDESYYIDKISDYIAEHVLQPEERDFNQTVLFGSDVTASQVADYARRYPMMSEYRSSSSRKPRISSIPRPWRSISSSRWHRRSS